MSATDGQLELDSDGVRELLTSDAMKSALLDMGDQVAAAFQSIAPVGVDPDGHPGQYRNSVKVWAVQHKNRVVVRVGSDLDYALYLEALYRPLGRALDGATGTRTKGSAKAFRATRRHG